MKFFTLIGLVALTASCQMSKSKDEAPASEQDKFENKIGVGIEKSDAFSLVAETAYVKSVDLLCTLVPNSVVDFTEGNQTAIIYSDITSCEARLKKFVVTIDGDEVEYTRNNGPVVQNAHQFDGDDGSLKLANGDFDAESFCIKTTEESECKFTMITANFLYSELLVENIDLENDLDVAEMTVEIEKENAPSCDVVPHFEQTGSAEPTLVIDIDNCVDLFNTDLEFTLESHNMGDEYNIVDIHALITAHADDFDASGSHQIVLTVADLKAIAGTTDVFVALTTDLVLGIRNPGGISAKYYTLDNQCELKEEL
jgi:hypothetical protein